MTIGTPQPHRGAYLFVELVLIAAVAIAALAIYLIWS